MTPARIRLSLVAAFATLALLGAACANDSNSASGGAYGGGTTGAAAGSGGTTGATSGGTTGGGAYGGGGGNRYGYGGGGGGGQGSGGGGAQMADVTLSADNFAFSPVDVQAKSGTEILIQNANASTTHSFTVDGTSIDVTLEPGTIESAHVDLDPGTYRFHCRFHASMTGTLTVT